MPSKITSIIIATIVISCLFLLLLKVSSVELTGHTISYIVITSFIVINGIASNFLSANAVNSLKHLSLWLGLFIAIIIIYTFRWELNDGYRRVFGAIVPSYSWSNNMGKNLAISKSTNGHFYVSAYVNGVKVKFMIDTGASDIALTRNDAESIGIDISKLKFDMKYLTANGEVSGAAILIKNIKIGDKIFTGLRGHLGSGDLDVSLLGMSVIERFKSFKIDKDVLYLEY